VIILTLEDTKLSIFPQNPSNNRKNTLTLQKFSRKMDEKEVRWYVIGSVTRRRELKIRDELRRDEHECFVPLQYEVRKVGGQRRRIMVPAVPGLIFLRGTLEGVKEAIKFRSDGLYIRKSTFSNKEDYLSVSEHDMRNFIAVSEQAGEKITYYNPDEIHLQVGDKIRVNGGMFDGREGVIMRIKGKRRRQLVVSIPGIVYAAVELEPELLELISPEKNGDTKEKTPKENAPKERHRNKNIDEDKKLLFELAHRLLFEVPTSYQHEKEYYLWISELRRVRERLLPFKGYIAAQEAELALPLYLAAVKLGEDVEAAEQRVRKVMDRLNDISFQKLHIRLYLAQLAGDEDSRRFVEEQIASWKGVRLSARQKEFIAKAQLVLDSPQQ
jgi:transcription antitermination factor NusG